MACTHALKLSDSPFAAPALRPAIAIMPLRGVGASQGVVQQASADLQLTSVGSYLMLRAHVPYDTCPRNISHGPTYRMTRATNVAPWLRQWARQSAANDREQPVGAALVVL